ncbi:hypothetical protein BM1_07023 [Bipolaris maydis]|nr:hypothetical protein BM1_07023 [Bipolaris maydis]
MASPKIPSSLKSLVSISLHVCPRVDSVPKSLDRRKRLALRSNGSVTNNLSYRGDLKGTINRGSGFPTADVPIEPGPYCQPPRA